MWYLLLYLIGIIVSWFIIAHMNDNQPKKDEMGSQLGLLSWLFVLACLLIILWDMTWNSIKDLKIFHPSLKYFKKNDRTRKK